jgi:hypothetical protein
MPCTRRAHCGACQAEGQQDPVCSDATGTGSRVKEVPGRPFEERICPPEPGTRSECQRVDKSFATILELAGLKDFLFHDLRHTFASWYMMNREDEVAKILGHANIKITERYAKLAKTPFPGRVARHARRGDWWKEPCESKPREPLECSLIVPAIKTHASGDH